MRIFQSNPQHARYKIETQREDPGIDSRNTPPRRSRFENAAFRGTPRGKNIPKKHVESVLTSPPPTRFNAARVTLQTLIARAVYPTSQPARPPSTHYPQKTPEISMNFPRFKKEKYTQPLKKATKRTRERERHRRRSLLLPPFYATIKNVYYWMKTSSPDRRRTKTKTVQLFVLCGNCFCTIFNKKKHK